MLKAVFMAMLYAIMFFSLLLIDYALGNGFVSMTHRVFCKIFCFIKKTVREETKFTQTAGQPMNVPMLLIEVLTLLFTVFILNKYKQYQGRDRLDELLNESKEALRQTNEFIEKWRLRRASTERTYLDDDPQPIKPLNLEIPILHMAIVDTLGTTRSQPERGDAGDAINISDSTLLSMSSLLDNDYRQLSTESIPEVMEEPCVTEDPKVEFRSRLLWDVMEEDSNYSE